ncbi:EndoU domain-containing protein, partial [Brevibacillus parabrevis]
PVTDKKGNDANKNQSHEKEKAGAEGTGNVPPVIKTFNISEEALDHANIGDFTKNPRTGAIQKMSGGGHGQDNIDFLEQNGIEYNIETTFPNGVRIGNVPEHKSKGKRTGTGQAWFPSNWNKEDIRRAGEYVANLPQNQGIADGVGVFGNYNGVRVGVIKTNGEIGTVFPDNSMQP